MHLRRQLPQQQYACNKTYYSFHGLDIFGNNKETTLIQRLITRLIFQKSELFLQMRCLSVIHHLECDRNDNDNYFFYGFQY